MSAATPAPAVCFDLATPDEMAADTRPDTDWVWHGYLAAGHVTLLTSQWKCGKTTLLSVLLARLGPGGTLAGRAVRAGKAVVVSEEPKALWVARARHLGIGPHARFLCRPFRGARPAPDQWRALIDHLVAVRRRDGLDLVVVDPLAAFLPGRTENDAGTVLEMLLPLQALTDEGVAVQLLHHPRKGGVVVGQMARGSGALAGSADILVEMDGLSGPADDDRRRKLAGFSRYSATPRRLVIELTADGTDYAALGDYTAAEFEDGWQVLFWVLEDADRKLTRARILERWPADYKAPDPATVWRWLDRAVKDGRVKVDGTGRTNSPFRYWLAANEARWAQPYRLPDLPPLDEVFGVNWRGEGPPTGRGKKGSEAPK